MTPVGRPLSLEPARFSRVLVTARASSQAAFLPTPALLLLPRIHRHNLKYRVNVNRTATNKKFGKKMAQERAQKGLGEVRGSIACKKWPPNRKSLLMHACARKQSLA
jgi:hypothetical protein